MHKAICFNIHEIMQCVLSLKSAAPSPTYFPALNVCAFAALRLIKIFDTISSDNLDGDLGTFLHFV